MTLRRNYGMRASAVAGIILAGLAAAGCAQSARPRQASVAACTQFGIRAIERHVTVTSVPAACEGLARAQVNFAVSSALHAMAVGAHGKVRQRERAVKLSHFLAHLVLAVPGQRSGAPVSAPAVRQVSRTELGLVALFAWLITVGLGSAMMARQIARDGLRRARPGPAQVPPSVIFAHVGLALTGLLTWIIYLVTGLTSVAWTACALLLPAAGLGMALVILSLPERSVPDAIASAAQAGLAGAAPAQLRGDPPPGRHPSALIVAAHGVFAVATILFALLAALGTG